VYAASAATTHTSSTSHRNRTLHDPIAPNTASAIPRREDDADGAALLRPESVVAIGGTPLNRPPGNPCIPDVTNLARPWAGWHQRSH
jgi:hypothetical protein